MPCHEKVIIKVNFSMSTLWNSFNVVRLARVSNSAGTETDGPGSNLYHRTVSYEGGCGWWVLTKRLL